MSHTVAFSNPGLIDMRGITTFGVNAKESDNPIGFFGTGLKYAIAVLLRHGHEVTLHRGDESYQFGVRRDTVRGKEFDFVFMNGPCSLDALGFTTELGKKWDLWMAFRELYSNMLDEGGECIERAPPDLRDKTVFIVRGAAFYDVYLARGNYFLAERPGLGKALVSSEDGQVFDQPCESVFSRGICVGAYQKPALFTYNFSRGIELTEDRTVRNPYMLPYLAGKFALLSGDEHFVRRVLTANDQSFEFDLDFASIWTPSETFMKVLRSVRGDPSLSRAARVALAKFCSIGEAEPAATEPLRHETRMIAYAIAQLSATGYEVTQEITVTTALPENMLGCAFRPTNKIFLSRSVFNQGQDRVTSTLFEEYLHLHYKLEDESRPMQNFLFDLVVSLMGRAA